MRPQDRPAASGLKQKHLFAGKVMATCGTPSAVCLAGVSRSLDLPGMPQSLLSLPALSLPRVCWLAFLLCGSFERNSDNSAPYPPCHSYRPYRLFPFLEGGRRWWRLQHSQPTRASSDLDVRPGRRTELRPGCYPLVNGRCYQKYLHPSHWTSK